MQKIKIINAKNGSKTCTIENKFLHSSYNPEKEAERFVEEIDCNFNPKLIFITEPALSYCCDFLKKRFFQSKIIAIRYTHFFDNYNSLFDDIFYILEITDNQLLEKNISEKYKEDELCNSLFLAWNPSANIFSPLETETWKIFKRILEKNKTLLVTKSYFSKRWIKNSINFCSNARKIINIKRLNVPIVIVASGLSLQNSIPTLKILRNKFFLICVSSALSVLSKYNIIPDFVISTDAGFWAKIHLFPLLKNKTIPLAIPAEAACEKKILQNSPIIPLIYPDGIESSFSNIWIEKTNSKYIKAERNGTVSGTAAKIALNLTNNLIYAFGLDLASSNGFQHTQPNLLELSNSKNDFKLLQKEQRQVISSFNSDSLKIYESWFKNESKNIYKRFFRVSKNFNFKNKLDMIEDIDIDLFFNQIKNLPDLDTKDFFIDEKNISTNEIKNVKKEIEEFINRSSKKEFWYKNIFPSEYMLYEKYNDKAIKEKKHYELLEKNNEFIKELKKLLHENYL